ncbi:MAG: DinB family protein [Candidatus Kapabacteria bacterium]|nr:DinB family protein [Ignavibacteriota bacterium]MCW5885223.1 DinB family protein [Candidatus Kapabacteria bacterium]
MFSTIDEFLAEWANECQATMRIFKELTDQSLSQKGYEDGRTLGFLAWHITNTIGEMMSKAGLDVTVSEKHYDEPESVEQIISEYEKQSQAMVKSMNEKWTNETLDEDFNMYGETWKGKMILSALIKHEIHHRAQMTVLMRQAGLKVPGVYGPSKEEWSAYGAPAMK